MNVASSDAAIVVYEQTPYWGPEIQRQVDQSGIVIRECRSHRDLMIATREFVKALIVIDLSCHLERTLEWLSTAPAMQISSIPIVALGSSETADLEWILREAGVTAFVPNFITGSELARLCRRQLGLMQSHSAR